MMKEEINRVFGNKKCATIYQDELGFVVECAIEGRIMQKTRHMTIQLAQQVAEDFVTDQITGPTFLTED